MCGNVEQFPFLRHVPLVRLHLAQLRCGARFTIGGFRRGKLPGADRFEQRRGLLLWFRAQFGLEEASAFLILAQCSGVLPGPGIQPHQRAMRRLVQRV